MYYCSTYCLYVPPRNTYEAIRRPSPQNEVCANFENFFLGAQRYFTPLLYHTHACTRDEGQAVCYTNRGYRYTSKMYRL